MIVLLDDLTKYNPKLVKGVKGKIAPPELYGALARKNPHIYTTVIFDDVCIDVLRTSIMDEEQDNLLYKMEETYANMAINDPVPDIEIRKNTHGKIVRLVYTDDQKRKRIITIPSLIADVVDAKSLDG